MSAFGGKADMTGCGCLLSRSLLGVKRTLPFAAHMCARERTRTGRLHCDVSAVYRRRQDGSVAAHRRYLRRTPHKTRVELLYRANAALLHCRTRLGADEVEHTFDTLLPKGAETPEVWPPNASRMRAHGKCLDHVGATTEPAVDDHRHATVHCRDDFWKRVDC